MKKNIFQKITAKNNGIAILLSLLVMGVLTSIIIVMTSIFTSKLKISVDAKYSVSAYYTAESGVEWCLYKLKVDPTPVATPEMDNGGTFTVSTCTSSTIKSIGKFRNTTRAIEVEN